MFTILRQITFINYIMKGLINLYDLKVEKQIGSKCRVTKDEIHISTRSLNSDESRIIFSTNGKRHIQNIFLNMLKASRDHYVIDVYIVPANSTLEYRGALTQDNKSLDLKLDYGFISKLILIIKGTGKQIENIYLKKETV